MKTLLMTFMMGTLVFTNVFAQEAVKEDSYREVEMETDLEGKKPGFKFSENGKWYVYTGKDDDGVNRVAPVPVAAVTKYDNDANLVGVTDDGSPVVQTINNDITTRTDADTFTRGYAMPALVPKLKLDHSYAWNNDGDDNFLRRHQTGLGLGLEFFPGAITAPNCSKGDARKYCKGYAKTSQIFSMGLDVSAGMDYRRGTASQDSEDDGDSSDTDYSHPSVSSGSEDLSDEDKKDLHDKFSAFVKLKVSMGLAIPFELNSAARTKAGELVGGPQIFTVGAKVFFEGFCASLSEEERDKFALGDGSGCEKSIGAALSFNYLRQHFSDKKDKEKTSGVDVSLGYMKSLDQKNGHGVNFMITIPLDGWGRRSSDAGDLERENRGEEELQVYPTRDDVNPASIAPDAASV